MAASPEDRDVIPVRDDERLDEVALAAWLRENVAGAEGPLAVRQFGGGHANLTYLLRLGAGAGARELVLRRPPLGPLPPGAHDMAREYRALSVLWQAFPPAPRAYAFCEDEGVIGAPFFVMERRSGVVVRAGGVPPEYGGGHDEHANRRLSEVVIDTLAEFHAVDPKPIGLDALGRDPEHFLERQVKGWADRYERSASEPVPVAEDVVRWLLDRLPPSPAPTLLHNDWKLDNMALDPADPGRCVAVYDWDMCTVGDPLCDLGTVMALWSNRGDPMAGTNPMPTQSPGFMAREEAIRRYGERSGRDVSGVSYYDVFGTFKMGVVLQQIHHRFLKGQTRDARFEGLGRAALALYELASARRP